MRNSNLYGLTLSIGIMCVVLLVAGCFYAIFSEDIFKQLSDDNTHAVVLEIKYGSPMLDTGVVAIQKRGGVKKHIPQR